MVSSSRLIAAESLARTGAAVPFLTHCFSHLNSRAAIELALDPETDQRVRSVLIVAGLDRAGVKPMDYDPAQDVTPPSWDPGALTDEERENLKAYLVKMVRKGKP
jgi:hypothetical protein